MIANMLGKEGLGTATGVDLAGHRLATCRSLLRKYKVGEKVRLFEADGTSFAVSPPTRLGNRVIHQEDPTKKRQRVESIKPFWAPRMLRSNNHVNSHVLYDKVLVDAECTHDGSILHILKVSNGTTKRNAIPTN
jgi:16S rRNA C967 or C1407 C5-methylase (RsmB/RsmF family)